MENNFVSELIKFSAFKQKFLKNVQYLVLNLFSFGTKLLHPNSKAVINKISII